MNLIQKTNVFFKEVWVELKRVSWLSQKEVIRYTLIVLGVTVVVAAFLGGLDYIFQTIIYKLIIK